MAQKDLKPVRTKEEAKARGRNGGIKSGEARRAKKSMRETAKALMSMEVVGENNKKNLKPSVSKREIRIIKRRSLSGSCRRL